MHDPSSAPKTSSPTAMLALTPLKFAWTALVICTPVLGFWLASSLATYLNGPVWTAGLVGALAFPILPLVWEWRGWVKHRRKKDANPRILTFMDRMTLRTLAINLVLIGSLLALFPQASFLALSTRGDWMLEGSTDARSEQVRAGLFATAEGLEFLYLLTVDNPYEDLDDGSSSTVVPKPNTGDAKRRIRQTSEDEGGNGSHITITFGKDDDDKPTPTPTPTPTPEPKPEPEPEPERKAGEAPAWPMKATMHPLVATIPASQQTSIEQVSRYIASKETDPFQRVKAMHDYVVDRLKYDHDRLRRNDLTAESQRPEVVFSSKLAVCAGYAKLLVEMGKYTGDEIVYVVGDTRDDAGNPSDVGHAWNAVKIEGYWYHMDATWNDPTNPDRPSKTFYRTTYLFTPSHIFGVDHFPKDAIWQLRDTPLTRGEFLRQPLVDPAFYVAGLEFIDPKRSQVTAPRRSFTLKLGNTKRNRILTRLAAKGTPQNQSERQCKVSGGKVVSLKCDAPSSGTYHVQLFAGPKHQSTLSYVGRFEVHVP